MVSHTQHYLICVCETQSCKHCHSFTDSYSEVVPIDGPPSFRGQAVKYVYKLTIGCQRVNSPIKLLRVPFRVLVLQGEWTFDRLWLSFYSCSHRETGVERSLLRLQYNIRTTAKPEKYWQKKMDINFCCGLLTRHVDFHFSLDSKKSLIMSQLPELFALQKVLKTLPRKLTLKNENLLSDVGVFCMYPHRHARASISPG